MSRRLQTVFCVILGSSLVLAACGFAWNIPGHMVSGSIAYQILRSESPATIAAVKAILIKHPWYESRWKEQLEKLPESERDEMLFMLAPRWADDIRVKDRSQHRGPWHYTNLPFKPDAQPVNIGIIPPEAINILTALAENEQVAKTEIDPTRKSIALSWLFHLVGDIHQPLHATQIFTIDYPGGDRGGNLICLRTSEQRRAINLHELWDRLITTSNNIPQLRIAATMLRNKPEFGKNQLTELTSTDFESWTKESFQIATLIAYQNGHVPGTPKGDRKECSEVVDAKLLPNGYARVAGLIADRRMTLAGFRLADLLKRL